MFGENFTTEGLLEDQANIGDEYQIGSAKFAVTQPRMPCFKLGIKFESTDVIKKLFASAKCGIYFKVLEEGEVGAGDEIKLVKRDENNVTIRDIMKTYGNERNHKELIQRALKIDALPTGWKSYYNEILQS
jgi:MOSC domain-containing protein YiiM